MGNICSCFKAPKETIDCKCDNNIEPVDNYFSSNDNYFSSDDEIKIIYILCD
jgi:hypothetical protein